VAAGWVAHVGSADESPGATGIAHLIEHLLFKGTRVIGTTDFGREQAIMERLDALAAEARRELIALRHARRQGPIADGPPENAWRLLRLGELQQQMAELEEEQRQLIVKEEYSEIYSRHGASRLNAATGHDFSVFFVTVPANKLELWFWMEADRLAHPVFRELYSEIAVVLEERRTRVESDPVGEHFEQFDAMSWTSLPYRHPIGGWPYDLELVSRAQVRQFFATHYTPDNITAVLVGDFDSPQAVRLAERYLGTIANTTQRPPDAVGREIPQVQERRMRAAADINPEVVIRWHSVPFVHRDVYALDVISEVLAGRSGRLYRLLVEETGIATGEPYAVQQPMKLGGLFEVGASVAEGHDLAEVESALLSEIERLRTEPIDDRELERAKNQSLAFFYRRLESNSELLLDLMASAAMGDWRYVNQAPSWLGAITADDVLQVARKYLRDEGRNVLWLERREE
jgi:predicted Zn-dependent peptidase